MPGHSFTFTLLAGSLLEAHCAVQFFSEAAGSIHLWSWAHLIIMTPGLHLPSVPQCMVDQFFSICQPNHVSAQPQTIMQHHHLVHLAWHCQWPRTAQYFPTPIIPLLKIWNTKSSLLGPCRPSAHQTGCKSGIQLMPASRMFGATQINARGVDERVKWALTARMRHAANRRGQGCMTPSKVLGGGFRAFMCGSEYFCILKFINVHVKLPGCNKIKSPEWNSPVSLHKFTYSQQVMIIMEANKWAALTAKCLGRVSFSIEYKIFLKMLP